MQNIINFQLNNSEKIVMSCEENLDQINCCTEGSLTLIEKNNEILLSNDTIHESIFVLHGQLQKALNSDLILHRSITSDIGCLYNEELQDKPGLVYEKFDERDHWVGYNFLLWSSNMATWLYNDYVGNIILEITPVFPGNFISFAEDKISYGRWLQNYKPYLIRKLPKEVAQQWLYQADHLLKKIEENVEREMREYKKKQPNEN